MSISSEVLNRTKMASFLSNFETRNASGRFKPVAPVVFCCCCIGELARQNKWYYATEVNDSVIPTSTWVDKAKKSRGTGSDKLFSKQLADKVERLHKTVVGKRRTEQQKEHDRELLQVCTDLSNKESFRRAADWVSQVGSKDGPIQAFMLYGRTTIKWPVVLKGKANYRALRNLLRQEDSALVADIPLDRDAPGAINKLASAL